MIILYFANMADLKIKQTKAKQHCDFYLFIYLPVIFIYLFGGLPLSNCRCAGYTLSILISIPFV